MEKDVGDRVSWVNREAGSSAETQLVRGGAGRYPGRGVAFTGCARLAVGPGGGRESM